MKIDRRIPIITGLAVLVIGVVLVTQSYGSYTTAPDSNNPSLIEGEPTQKFETAAFSFGVTELNRTGSDVTFTIPKDARVLEEKADAVVVSGLYDSQKEKPVECPLVESTAVEKSVENYNPITGEAQVKAHFDDEAVAQAAIEQGCLLINDP